MERRRNVILRLILLVLFFFFSSSSVPFPSLCGNIHLLLDVNSATCSWLPQNKWKRNKNNNMRWGRQKESIYYVKFLSIIIFNVMFMRHSLRSWKLPFHVTNYEYNVMILFTSDIFVEYDLNTLFRGFLFMICLFIFVSLLYFLPHSNLSIPSLFTHPFIIILPSFFLTQTFYRSSPPHFISIPYFFTTINPTIHFHAFLHHYTPIFLLITKTFFRFSRFSLHRSL